MMRTVKPELLDSLPHDDPEALRNRRDLRLFNWLMGSHAWMRSQLRLHARPDDRILEIGAGEGELIRCLKRDSRLARSRFDGLDRCPEPSGWPQDRRWRRTHLESFQDWQEYDIVLANLILHQFDDVDLHAIGRGLRSGPRALIVQEPARRRRHLRLCGLLTWFLCKTTQHDARVSIEAGFMGDELAQCLGLKSALWRTQVDLGWLGQYRFVATRCASPG